MLVSEMAQAVLKEDAPVCIEAFDGSTFGPEDADLQVRVTSPKAIYQLASNLNEIGLARAYILGYFDIEGLDVADPYPQLRKLVELASYIRKPSPLELATHGGRPFSATATTRWRCRSPKAPRNSNASSPVCSRTPKRPTPRPSASIMTCRTSSTPTSLDPP